GKKSIPEGAIIVVDPEMPYSSGSLVVACLDDSIEATFKQLVIDGDQRYLKPLNPQYPAIPINDNCTIVGVVKQAIIDFF
ncbi:LexA family transcriptional regulator, partial [Vibrio cholerae]|nr:LexA family transcriptional regulator [Vibrio cholerae]